MSSDFLAHLTRLRYGIGGKGRQEIARRENGYNNNVGLPPT